MSDLSSLGKSLMGAGLLILLAGAILALSGKVPWLGRLPGDLHVERPGFSFYFPLGTCLLASAFLSLAAWLVSRLR